MCCTRLAIHCTVAIGSATIVPLFHVSIKVAVGSVNW